MRDTAGSAAAPAARWRKYRRGSFILNLPSHHSITSSARTSSGSVMGRRASLHVDDPRSCELATSSSADGPFTLHSTLDHLAKDRLDVCLRKRSQRLRANISKGAAAQSKRSHGNIIRCLDNRNDIVLA